MNLLRILDGTPEPPIIDIQLDRINQSGDYHLATPMYEFQKELTDQIVSLHYPDILKYCETNDTKELIIKSLEICINNCILVSTHPYLLINHYMPKNLASKDMSTKLADTSGKFNVLKDLMNVIISNPATKPRNIGVVMNNNVKFFDLVEALLLGCSGNKLIKRYVGNYVKKESTKNNKGNNDINGPQTTIHLLPFDGKVIKDEDAISSIKFDVLVVFDSYVDTNNEFFTKIRTQNRRGESIIIRLVPMKAIEHCQLYYVNKKDEKGYLYKLISSIVCLRDHIGNLQPDIFPIYNQNLKYLSNKFFDNVFKGNNRSSKFPSWPLPDLPKIPKFNPTDVERSLLTEVHFHYTPYDSNDLSNINNEKPEKSKRIKTYYESKRLESDYVTNPLKNDFNQLVGILPHDNTNYLYSNKSDMNPRILTHKLIMQLSNAFLDLDNIEQEYNGYLEFNKSETQKRNGRREMEMKQLLSKLLDDIDHAESRISSADKQIIKKSEEINNMKEQTTELENKLADFTKANGVEDENLSNFIDNQIRIWEHQSKIQETLIKINSKNEEKNYMSKEYQNSVESIKESELQISSIKEVISENKRKLDSLHESEVEENKKFKSQKQNLIDEIENEKMKNENLKQKLEKSLRFLNNTSHLKKRKSRGLTPSSK